MCRCFHRRRIFKNDLMDKIIPDALVPYSTLIIILVLAVICKVLLDLYLNTKSGFLLRAVGDNDVLVVSLAKDKGNIKILGLAICKRPGSVGRMCVCTGGASI